MTEVLAEAAVTITESCNITEYALPISVPISVGRYAMIYNTALKYPSTARGYPPYMML